MWDARDAISAFLKESLAKNFPEASNKATHFRLGNGFDFSILGSGYRVARLFSNFDLSFG